MIVRELLDRLNIKEEDVIRISENSYSRNELYSLPKNELIFDKEVKKFSLKTQNENDFHTNGFVYMSYPEKFLVIEV